MTISTTLAALSSVSLRRLEGQCVCVSLNYRAVPRRVVSGLFAVFF